MRPNVSTVPFYQARPEAGSSFIGSSQVVRGPLRNLTMRPRPTINVRRLFLLARPLAFWRLSSLVCSFQTRRPCQSSPTRYLSITMKAVLCGGGPSEAANNFPPR